MYMYMYMCMYVYIYTYMYYSKTKKQRVPMMSPLDDSVCHCMPIDFGPTVGMFHLASDTARPMAKSIVALLLYGKSTLRLWAK